GFGPGPRTTGCCTPRRAASSTGRRQGAIDLEVPERPSHHVVFDPPKQVASVAPDPHHFPRILCTWRQRSTRRGVDIDKVLLPAAKTCVLPYVLVRTESEGRVDWSLREI